MTYKEALYQITNYGLDEGPKELAEAVEIFRKATEKQMPKKPMNITVVGIDNHDILFGDCPNCKERLYKSKRFCHKCGQAIDWKKAI